jgi:hypothetical protein
MMSILRWTQPYRYERGMAKNVFHPLDLAGPPLIVFLIDATPPIQTIRTTPVQPPGPFFPLTNGSGEDTLDELGMVGAFLTDIGRLKVRGEIERFVFNKRARILGEEHPSTITAINNLAITLGDLGQLGDVY